LNHQIVAGTHQLPSFINFFSELLPRIILVLCRGNIN
jgi:hypothetical protein